MTENGTSKRDKIAEFLKQKTSQGKQYFKSKKIAEELDLSSRSVGQHLLILQDEDPRLSIEEYANSRSTTWLITQKNTTEPLAAD